MGWVPRFKLRDKVRVVPTNRFPIWMNQYQGQVFEVASISMGTTIESPYTLKGKHHAFREEELQLVERNGVAYTGKDMITYPAYVPTPVREPTFDFNRMFK